MLSASFRFYYFLAPFLSATAPDRPFLGPQSYFTPLPVKSRVFTFTLNPHHFYSIVTHISIARQRTQQYNMCSMWVRAMAIAFHCHRPYWSIGTIALLFCNEDGRRNLLRNVDNDVSYNKFRLGNKGGYV
jgi:hypothetical protein